MHSPELVPAGSGHSFFKIEAKGLRPVEQLNRLIQNSQFKGDLAVTLMKDIKKQAAPTTELS